MNVTDIIHSAVLTGRTRFSFEVLPPLKGEGVSKLFHEIDAVVEYDPASINVTYHRETLHERTLPDGTVERHNARRRPGTVGISAAIQRRFSVETVPHLICCGNSRYDIEDALIDMEFSGLHNVLALRGDKLPAEERFTPHPEGYAHAADLVAQIAAMNRGQFIDGEPDVCSPSHFSIGVAGYPECHSEAESCDSDLRYLKAKVEAGAHYIVTQLFFDNSRFLAFRDRCREAGIGLPIIPGIKPLSTLRHLSTLPRIFGCRIPGDLEREVRRYGDDPKAVRRIGTEWAIAQTRELKAAGVPMVHYYTMSRTDQIREIVRAVF